MIFAELPLAEARGAMLAHAIDLAGRRWPKGSTVDDLLTDAAMADGILSLWVARPEEGDISEDDAADAIARRMAGSGIEIRKPANGRVNLHAATGGLVLLEPDAVCAANRQSDAVGISTRHPLSPVTAGDIVATVKIIPYAIPGRLVDGVDPGRMEIRPWRTGLSATLTQTRRPGMAEKMLAKTSEVTMARLSSLGVDCTETEQVAHAVEPLAAALRASSAPLRLVAGATATSDRRDVIPAAIEAAGGEVLRVGMPVDPGNLLVVGRLQGAIVIGLPGCARSPRRNGLDLVLERWAAGLEVTSSAIAAMGVGGLLEEGGRTVPWGWGG